MDASPLTEQFRARLAMVFSGGFVRSLCSMLQGFLLARFLGSTEFGQFSYVMAVVGFVFGLVDFRIQQSVVKFTSELLATDHTIGVPALSLVFLLLEAGKGILGFLLVWFIYQFGYLGQLGFSQGGSVLIPIALFQLCMTLNPSLTAWMQIRECYRAISIYDFAFGILSLSLVGSVAYFTGRSVDVAWAYMFVGACGGFAKALIVIWMFRQHLTELSISSFTHGFAHGSLPWRRIARFVFGLNLASSLRIAARHLDIIILGWFVPAQTIGEYSLARRLRLFLYYLVDPLTTLIYPEFSRLYAESRRETLSKLFHRLLKLAFLVATPLCIAAALFAPWLIPAVFGEGYAVGTVVILWVFLIDSVFLVTFFTVPQLCLAMGKVRYTVMHSGISLFGVLGLGVPSAYFSGALGMAFAVMLSSVAGTIWMYRMARQQLDAEMRV